MQPIIPITNPLFKYVPSYSTDLRKTFERVYKVLEQVAYSDMSAEVSRAKIRFVLDKELKYLYECDKE